jgi:cation:H+ antiporter
VLAAALTFVAGLACLLVGGDWLVRGAAALARRAGVSTLTIGLTVVAFGTSAPELALNVAAAAGGETGLVFGNMVGACIANVGVSLGVAAMVHPIRVEPGLLRKELPVLALVTGLAIALALLPPGAGGDARGLARADGVLLVLGFGALLAETVRTARRRGGVGPELAEGARDVAAATPALGPRRAAALVGGGVAALALGGKLAETGAVEAAARLGVGQAVVGLTVVSVATTLPEALTGVAAARRGETDLALGNVVGSNLFNLLFILGLAAAIGTVPVAPGGGAALAALGVSVLLLFPVSVTFGWTITRLEGGLLALGWCGFVAWTVVAAAG